MDVVKIWSTELQRLPTSTAIGTVRIARLRPYDAGHEAVVRERTVAALEVALQHTDVWVDDGQPTAHPRPRTAAALAAAVGQPSVAGAREGYD